MIRANKAVASWLRDKASTHTIERQKLLGARDEIFNPHCQTEAVWDGLPIAKQERFRTLSQQANVHNEIACRLLELAREAEGR